MAAKYITRDEATANSELVNLLIQVTYEAGRMQGSSRPPWSQVLEAYKIEARKCMILALSEAKRAGYQITKP